MVVAADEMPTEILGKIRTVIKNYCLVGRRDRRDQPTVENFTLDPDKIEEHRKQFDLLKASQRYVVTLKKQYEYKSMSHKHFARMTLTKTAR